MKITLALITALLLTFTATAQDTNAPSGDIKARAITFVQDASEARTLVLAAYPSYAPDLKLANGKSASWGVGAAALYPVSQFVYTGIRVDYLGGSLWAPSINLGLKADVQIFGLNFTPLAYTGAVVPLSGSGDTDGDFGYIIGGGIKATLWKGTVFGKEASLDVAATAEKWSQFDGEVYHLAPVFRIKW